VKRYIVGVDLGTTNSAVAEVDSEAARVEVETVAVPQLVAPGELAGRRQLPSLIYMPGEHDLGPAETALPWNREARLVVGELAQIQGARNASRLVSSAKSWLCHGGVDRNDDILPWGAEGADKMSPVAASAAILEHVKSSWQHLRGADLGEHEVVVTVPASFDEAARELTLAAAERAGFPDVILLEEPQAAFYAWIDSHGGADRAKLLEPGDRVLVFDIGGGTTDFTLISVGGDGESFERTAVGDHLLLGGDNVDLALAKLVEGRLGGGKKKKLDAVQWHGLVGSCRRAKETLLSEGAAGSITVTVAGRGSKLIGGTLSATIDRGDLDGILIDGFFPEVSAAAEPARPRSGLQEFGLPYAADAGITRHLASFLRRHGADRIDAILFNGGAMTPATLRRRVVDQIAAWQGSGPRELANDLPELAVARGAAYYGLVRRGLGARIRGGTPRVFYVGVGAAQGDKALCVAPKGLEEGSRVELERDFELVTNRPVSFKLYSSTTRADRPGALVDVGDGLADMSADGSDLLELPPIVTVLRARGRSRVDVRLETRVTELGSLEIWCHERESDERWRLSFDIRGGGAARTDGDPGAELTDAEKAAVDLVIATFRGESDVEPKRLLRVLEERLDLRRDEWSMKLSRAMFDGALKVEDERKSSPQAEARWINLTGFCLRPGFGAPLDDWRVKQMWRVFNDGLAHPRAEACRLAWWITWRRVVGGLSRGQQDQFYDRLAQLFLPGPKQKKKWHEVRPSKQEALEMWRVLANLERVEVGKKIKLGDELGRRMESKKGRSEPVHWWALGRIGARMPLYGPLNAVVPPEHASRWLTQLLDADWPDPEKAAFGAASLGRRTGDRARDIDPELRERLAGRLEEIDGAERIVRLVREVVSLEAREEKVALGDSLPPGLRLVLDDEVDGDEGDAD
jgi:molecular chaperone DnaK (HSP70)